MTRRPPRSLPLVLSLVALVALAVYGAWAAGTSAGGPPRRVAYSELLGDVRGGQVAQAEIDSDEITGTLRPGDGHPAQSVVATRIPHIDERALLDAMEQQRVALTGRGESSWWKPLIWTILPLLALPFLWAWMASAMAARVARGRPLTVDQNKAKLYDRSAKDATMFSEVAGVDEAKAELVEVVEFLKHPEKYRAVGAHVPKGVLLVGAPGTGKTLLARAVAGESAVPFFSLSGSEFVEMFVGVGASRVRDLFEQAKQRAPCIVFIDELDALGKARSGAAKFVANEEREQTLIQLLVEMDGFDGGTGLIVMAATNRPEILERALLRAGRFDRQVLVDRPDLRGREAILRVHGRKVQLAPEVDLGTIARRTPGMVGADLANVVNEAALASVRRGADVVTMGDFEEAIDRLQLGLKKQNRVMTEDEKRRVAVHEAGHALVALTVPHADPVHKVTIIPRSIRALGATLQLPTEERYIMTEDKLRDRLCVLLGGCTAEAISCHVTSIGAEDDLERATGLARAMVCRFGMSHVLGPLTWTNGSPLRFLSTPDEGGDRDFSEETARTIDTEVRALVEAEHARAQRILEGRTAALEAIAGELLEHETIDGARLQSIAREHSGSVPAGSSAAS
jgi:cell division protease FtsH